MENDEIQPCYYCGLAATIKDHVIPKFILKGMERSGNTKAYAKLLERRILLVPCCDECNLLLGASYQRTLEDRKKQLKSKLRKKYKMLLKAPDWSDEELDELGPGLHKYIEGSEKWKRLLKSRLIW